MSPISLNRRVLPSSAFCAWWQALGKEKKGHFNGLLEGCRHAREKRKPSGSGDPEVPNHAGLRVLVQRPLRRSFFLALRKQPECLIVIQLVFLSNLRSSDHILSLSHFI